MARPKVSDFLKKARAEIDDLTGLERTLVDPILVEADAMRTFVEQLRLMVEQDGPMIEKEVGSVNNRHIEMVENPALTAYSKNVGRLGDLMKKVSSLCRTATPPEEEEEDELEAFLRR
jgi:hypothetical protein